MTEAVGETYSVVKLAQDQSLSPSFPDSCSAVQVQTLRRRLDVGSEEAKPVGVHFIPGSVLDLEPQMTQLGCNHPLALIDRLNQVGYIPHPGLSDGHFSRRWTAVDGIDPWKCHMLDSAR